MAITIEKECSNCSLVNYFYSLEPLIRNKCHSCSSTIDPDIEEFDIESLMNKHYSKGMPEVVPARCMDCTYFKKVGILDMYKGYCKFYETEVYGNYECVVTKVQKAIDSLYGKRTVIVVAHRLVTLANADHIYVLENGSLAEEGTHQNLKNGNGLYKRLCDKQVLD